MREGGRESTGEGASLEEEGIEWGIGSEEVSTSRGEYAHTLLLAQAECQCLLDSPREDFYKLVSEFTFTKGLRGAKTTFDVYTESWAQDPSQENKKKTVVDFETDVLFLVPTEIAIAQHRANAK